MRVRFLLSTADCAPCFPRSKSRSSRICRLGCRCGAFAHKHSGSSGDSRRRWRSSRAWQRRGARRKCRCTRCWPVHSEICVSLFALRTLNATGPSRITLSLRLIEYLESGLWARAGGKGACNPPPNDASLAGRAAGLFVVEFTSRERISQGLVRF